jgi:hypothetical protein
MKDMRMNSKDKKDFYSMPSVIDDKPEYPHGLEISLIKESMEKLGLDGSKLKVGDEFTMVAKVKVKSIREVNENGDVAEYASELQICEMELDKSEKEKSADAFYEAE